MKPIYSIGDKVYYIRIQYTEEYVTCPTCLGSKYIRFLEPDDTIKSIECQECRQGYSSSAGVVSYQKRSHTFAQGTIKSISASEEEIQYGIDNYIVNQDNITLDPVTAERAAAMAEERYNEQAKRYRLKKEKDPRSWSWHVTYYKGRIRDLQKQIEEYEEKLDFAKKKVKKK